MATIITKNSSTASSVPLAAQLVQGELAVNVTDKRLFTENSGGTVVELGTTPSSLSTGALAYTGTLTGGAGIINIGSGQVYKDASGNVGIGTSSPVSTVGKSLHLYNDANTGTVASNAFLLVESSTRNSVVEVSGSATSTNSFGFSDTAGTALAGIASTVADQNLQFRAGSNTERMRIDSSGNLGIGTSSPNVGGWGKAVTLQGVSNAAYEVTDGTVRSVLVAAGASVGLVGTETNHPFAFQTNGTERARIDSSGNLLVGTTSQYDVGQVCINYPDTKRGLAMQVNATGNSNQISFRNPNGIVGTISTSASGTTYATSSDYRLKEAIAPMTGALAKVAALKPCTYKWKVDGSDGQGFIAHELAEVEAGCVTGEKDATDADGKPQYQGIDTSFLVATLTAAIQEQQTLITALTARITALEAI